MAAAGNVFLKRSGRGCFRACIFYRAAVSHAHFDCGAERLVRERFCRQRALFPVDRPGARSHLCCFCCTPAVPFAAERLFRAAPCCCSGSADLAASPDRRPSLRRFHGHDGWALFRTLARTHVGNHEGQSRGGERRLCFRFADDSRLVDFA